MRRRRRDQSFRLLFLLLCCIAAIVSSQEETTYTFCGIADVPYTNVQNEILWWQMTHDIPPKQCRFLIHLGDLQKGKELCTRERFERTAKTLRKSPVPVFVIPGDNDWNDCTNPQEGWELYQEIFNGFESKHWKNDFRISRLAGRDETFTFEDGGVLFIGTHLVARPVLDAAEWTERLTEQVNWVMNVVRDYVARLAPNKGRVVLFGHAFPEPVHDEFFVPLQNFIQNELNNETPFAYYQGDFHFWQVEENFRDQSSWIRIQLAGEGFEPPTIFTVVSNGENVPTSQAFLYDRQLLPPGVCPHCKHWVPGTAVHKGIFGDCEEICSAIGPIKSKLLGWSCGPCP